MTDDPINSELLRSLLMEWWQAAKWPPAETPGFQLHHWINENLKPEDWDD